MKQVVMGLFLTVVVSAVFADNIASGTLELGEGSPPPVSGNIQTQSTTNNNGPLGSQISSDTTKAEKVFVDVNCDTLKCKTNDTASFYNSGGDDSAQKQFKIKPDS